MKNVYHGNWDSFENMERDFEEKLDKKKIKVLYAWYEYANYSGDAFVLFKQDGKLYEVNGSHCSCYGLEGQWSPEETSVEVLLKRRFPKVEAKTVAGLVKWLEAHDGSQQYDWQ